MVPPIHGEVVKEILIADVNCKRAVGKNERTKGAPKVSPNRTRLHRGASINPS